MKESPIFARTHDLLLWLMPVSLNFPREHRFVMAKRVQERALDFQELLLEAALDDSQCRELLARADVTLAKLRFHLRLCRELGLLQAGQYRHVAGMVTEIGRLLGGWQRSIGRQPAVRGAG